MSKNLGKHILSGFQPNFGRSYDTSFRYEKLNQERDETRKYNEDLKRLEDEKSRKSMEIVDRLLQGGRSGQTLRGGKPMFAPDDKQTQMKIASTLPANEFNRYQDLKKEFTPETKQDEYTYLDFSKPDGVYGYNKNKNSFEKMQEGNPIYQPKRTNVVVDYNANDEKVIREFFDNNTSKDTPTGFYKKHNSDGSGSSGDKFDLDKFNKTINSFSEEDIKINKLRSEYNVMPTDELKYEINAKNESNQATLYDLMDEESQGVVNEWFSQLKTASTKAGVDFRELEKRDQEKLKNKFIETISKSFDGSSKDYARKRALILYAKFKYNYVY